MTEESTIQHTSIIQHTRYIQYFLLRCSDVVTWPWMSEKPICQLQLVAGSDISGGDVDGRGHSRISGLAFGVEVRVRLGLGLASPLGWLEGWSTKKTRTTKNQEIRKWLSITRPLSCKLAKSVRYLLRCSDVVSSEWWVREYRYLPAVIQKSHHYVPTPDSHRDY